MTDSAKPQGVKKSGGKRTPKNKTAADGEEPVTPTPKKGGGKKGKGVAAKSKAVIDPQDDDDELIGGPVKTEEDADNANGYENDYENGDGYGDSYYDADE